MTLADESVDPVIITCGNCDFWHALPDTPATGRCQRNPPQAFLLPIPRVLEQGKFDNMLACAYPQTISGDVCGCHSQYWDDNTEA